MAAFLGASAALAGLLLVFIGFLYARGEGYANVRRGDLFKNVAKVGVLPFLVTLACASLSAEWFLGSAWAYDWAVWLFRIGLIATEVYGATTLLFLL